MSDTINLKLPPQVINIQVPRISAATQTVIDYNTLRITETGDTRITETGDLRILDGYDIISNPEIVLISLPNNLITIPVKSDYSNGNFERRIIR